MLLEHLRSQELVTSDNQGKWRLTLVGEKCVSVCYIARNLTSVFRGDLPPIALTDMSMWQLVQSLHQQGFKLILHQRSERKALRKLMFVDGDEKCWHHILGNQLNRFYLLALLDYRNHKKPVPALASNKIYQDLMGYEAPQRRRRRPTQRPLLADGDVSDAEQQAMPNKRRRITGKSHDDHHDPGLPVLLDDVDPVLHDDADSREACTDSIAPSEQDDEDTI